MKFLRLIDKGLAKVEGWLIVIFLGLMVTLTFLQVILRALYTHGHVQWANAIMGQVDWTEPFVRLLVLWITFLGALSSPVIINISRSISPQPYSL